MDIQVAKPNVNDEMKRHRQKARVDKRHRQVGLDYGRICCYISPRSRPGFALSRMSSVSDLAEWPESLPPRSNPSNWRKLVSEMEIWLKLPVLGDQWQTVSSCLTQLRDQIKEHTMPAIRRQVDIKFSQEKVVSWIRGKKPKARSECWK